MTKDPRALSAVPSVLFLGTNPKDLPRLRLDEEAKKIKRASERGQRRFEVVTEWAVTDEDLRLHLLRHRPTVAHLSGHAEDDGLSFEGVRGLAHVISSAALAELFAQCQEFVQCVVLNGCSSDGVAAAIFQHIPYVVGMRDDIGDDAALKFSAGFYDALAHGHAFAQAFAFGRNAIELAGISDSLVPTFKQRAGLPPRGLFSMLDERLLGTGLTPAQEHELIEFFADVYPTQKSANWIWQAAGGKPGRVDINSENAYELWQSLWSKAKRGAVKPTALLQAALEQYSNSEVLKRCLTTLGVPNQ